MQSWRRELRKDWPERKFNMVLYIWKSSGNVLCLFVFQHKNVNFKHSFKNILRCLSVIDIIFLVSIFSCAFVVANIVCYSLNIQSVPYYLPDRDRQVKTYDWARKRGHTVKSIKDWILRLIISFYWHFINLMHFGCFC